ncbi:DUF2304 domain-containing protein [Cellulomonas carbonis]|uniref:DUF2304 domain-containing protein n=1 Tax=Cellulomonas carbonis T26 TaxID=947969 RepID=A0A0A0BL88_9CELL|nr:DUF2304 domain-containing protein [Cellulomonas carbonis]KGM09258.1 hypothetical protein N868_03630 [Cellulomonas carbonis T26]GGC11260.1 hypothetical protein GCM10010972_25730 [Cellulomonas carbonis]
MTAYATALVLAVLTVAVMLVLLRSRRVREKYASAWFVLGAGIVLLGAFPGALVGTARLLGVQTPVNLLFLVGGVIALVVLVQFSVELSNLEEETRTLAEEVALLRQELDAHRDAGVRRPGLEPPHDDGA